MIGAAHKELRRATADLHDRLERDVDAIERLSSTTERPQLLQAFRNFYREAALLIEGRACRAVESGADHRPA